VGLIIILMIILNVILQIFDKEHTAISFIMALSFFTVFSVSILYLKDKRKVIFKNITQSPEWIIALGLVILSYNFIFEPGTCYKGLFKEYSCPNNVLTFTSVVLIILGIMWVLKKKKSS